MLRSAAAWQAGATLQWRTTYLGATSPSCAICETDPLAHCFFRVGTDADRNHVIYSCAARASNKDPHANCRHMACEMERIFDGNSASGRIVWLIDFNGFGVADCNPRMGATVLPTFSDGLLSAARAEEACSRTAGAESR